MSEYPKIETSPAVSRTLVTSLFVDGQYSYVTVPMSTVGSSVSVSGEINLESLAICRFFPDGEVFNPYPPALTLPDALRVLADDIEFAMAELSGPTP